MIGTAGSDRGGATGTYLEWRSTRKSVFIALAKGDELSARRAFREMSWEAARNLEDLKEGKRVIDTRDEYRNRDALNYDA